MNNIAVIILTLNEEKHIERCIRSVQKLTKNILVIDSFSKDCTIEIARSLGADVIQHEFKNHAAQFQWGLEQCSGDPEWLMRLDADEYLEPELQHELIETLPGLPEEVIGLYIRRRVYFQGRWIQHGGVYPQTLLRVWRAGQGRVEQRWMDEHIVLAPGAKAITLKGHIVDDNLKGISFWTSKHNGYATREMADILIKKYLPGQGDNALRQMTADPQARLKRIIKDEAYDRLPLGLRAFLYFFYRYFLSFGFLDGGEGFLYHFMQGLWYRFLVDLKVKEIEDRANGDLQKIREILHLEHGIAL